MKLSVVIVLWIPGSVPQLTYSWGCKGMESFGPLSEIGLMLLQLRLSDPHTNGFY